MVLSQYCDTPTGHKRSALLFRGAERRQNMADTEAGHPLPKLLFKIMGQFSNTKKKMPKELKIEHKWYVVIKIEYCFPRSLCSSHSRGSLTSLLNLLSFQGIEKT